MLSSSGSTIAASCWSPRGEVEPILDLPWEITPERITISDGRWRTRYEGIRCAGGWRCRW